MARARAITKRPKSHPGLKRQLSGDAKGPVGDENDSLETRIVSFAMMGKLKNAARAAVKSQLAAGLPVVYQAGNRILREHPDGTRELVRTVGAPSEPVPA